MSVNATLQDWTALVGRLQGNLEEVVSVDETIPNEATFQDKFVALSQENDEADPLQTYGSFIRHHQSMVFFIREIDTLFALQTPESLSDTFWTVAYHAIKAIFDLEYEFQALLDLFVELNKVLDLDQNELGKYSRDSKVQGCLQTIFEIYIECYIKLIGHCREHVTDFDPVEDQSDEATEVIQKKLIEWTEQREQAEKENSRLAREDTTEAQWEVLRLLGKGSYGDVHQVRETGTGTLYARKSIPKVIANLTPKQIEERVRNEVDIMRKLRHNHIANINILLKGDVNWEIIMLPVADCDLRVFLSEKCIKANYPHDAIRLIDSWFGCLISALTFAHAKQVKHQDIKPTNVLIKNKTVYLTDFGVAKDFSELENSMVGNWQEEGTPVYWAPENKPWGRAADVWALGCVFAEMLTVRQKRTLDDFKAFRMAKNADLKFAYRSNVEGTKRWLKDRIGINQRDSVGLTLVEQIWNMLIVDHNERLEAKRIRGLFRQHEERLFCATC